MARLQACFQALASRKKPTEAMVEVGWEMPDRPLGPFVRKRLGHAEVGPTAASTSVVESPTSYPTCRKGRMQRTGDNFRSPT